MLSNSRICIHNAILKSTSWAVLKIVDLYLNLLINHMLVLEYLVSFDDFDSMVFLWYNNSNNILIKIIIIIKKHHHTPKTQHRKHCLSPLLSPPPSLWRTKSTSIFKFGSGTPGSLVGRYVCIMIWSYRQSHQQIGMAMHDRGIIIIINWFVFTI
jgi:hypothetical protein